MGGGTATTGTAVGGSAVLGGADACAAGGTAGAAGEAASIAKTASQLGKEGEATVRALYDIGEKQIIRIFGRDRIPDGLTDAVLNEVKNVGRQAFTQQLRDYLAYATEKGPRFHPIRTGRRKAIGAIAGSH